MYNFINQYAADIIGFRQNPIYWRNTRNGVHANIVNARRASEDFAQCERNLPDPLSREYIASLFDDNKFYDGFMATMLWGHKHRLANSTTKTQFLSIVSENHDEIERKMRNLKTLLDNGDIITAFKTLYGNGDNQIKYVAEAFYTKLLYFITYSNPNIDPRPLILDSNMHYVRCALMIANNENYHAFYKYDFTKTIGNGLICLSCNTNNAFVYLDFLNRMTKATPAGARSDELEAFLFSVDLNIRGTVVSPRDFVYNYVHNHF